MRKTFYYLLSKISYAKEFIKILDKLENEYKKEKEEREKKTKKIEEWEDVYDIEVNKNYEITILEDCVNDYTTEYIYYCDHYEDPSLSFFRKKTIEEFFNDVYEIEEINGVIVNQKCEYFQKIDRYKKLKLYKEVQDETCQRDRILYAGEDGRYDNDISNAFDFEDNSDLELTELNKIFLFLSTKNI